MNYILSKIEPKIFLFSLGIGLLYCYLFTPSPDVLFVHPTPENSDTIYYNKMNNACYKYNKTQVQCTKDAIEKKI